MKMSAALSGDVRHCSLHCNLHFIGSFGHSRIQILEMTAITTYDTERRANGIKDM